jgi:hypothetical protein
MINWSTVGFLLRKHKRRAIQLVGSHFYINPDRDLHKSILVSGAARSGTTWLGDLIAAQIPSRIIFEPFNRDLVSYYRQFHYFQYMRPGTEDHELYDFAHKVLRGEIRDPWIDRRNERIYSHIRLVKEIRANLALRWLHENFPQVPILFLIRHPCAVVLSRMELGWATDRDIEPFLSQPRLIEDHLGPYLDLIHSAATTEEKHAVIWSVCNLVPLKQFNSSEWKVVYYENLCTQPEVELTGILGTIGHGYKKPVVKRSNQPSQTTRAGSAVMTGTDKIASWKKNLSRLQIDNIFRIVYGFGLGHLYGDSSLPQDKNVL